MRLTFSLWLGLWIGSGWAPADDRVPDPRIGAYIHIDQCFNAEDEVSVREKSISQTLDAIQRAGIDTIVPYVNTTSGQAHYPSDSIPENRWGDWDPIRTFVDGARQRDLKVHLCAVILNCGRDQPAGILTKHPDWALRDETGQPVGAISPGHPQARKWIVGWLRELTDRYQPDGLLMDYMRFPNFPTQFDLTTSAKFQRIYPDQKRRRQADVIQAFREQTLTELVGIVSKTLRAQQPELHLAIYSWGHHVPQSHRVAQAWPTWAAKGYIDEVNVCGYWYPDSYPKRWGDSHMDAFRTVITECQRLLKDSGGDTSLTFALGVKTSHGQVKTVVDIASYLRTAAEYQLSGVHFFTWSYLVPFLPQLDKVDLIETYSRGEPIEDLTTTNIDQGSDRNLVDDLGDQLYDTVLVATSDSSERARQAADFVGDGQGDQEQINAAIEALPPIGGTIQLAAGTYDIRKVDGTLGGVLIQRSQVTLAGQGSATKLVLAANQNTNVIRIIGSGIHHVTIRDLLVDANRDQNDQGMGDPNISHDRFEFCGIKGYCRDPRGPGAEDLHDITIRNCDVRNSHRLGIMLEGSNLRVLDNVLGNAGSDSVELLTGPGMIRGNYVEITGQTHVAIGSDRGNSIQMSDNIVHVKSGGRLDIGFRTWVNSQRHVIQGNTLIVDPGGICELAMDLRGQMQTVTGNTIECANLEATTRVRIGGGSTTLTGNLMKNVTLEMNDTYGDQQPILLHANVLDEAKIEHIQGNWSR